MTAYTVLTLTDKLPSRWFEKRENHEHSPWSVDHVIVNDAMLILSTIDNSSAMPLEFFQFLCRDKFLGSLYHQNTRAFHFHLMKAGGP
ncbi:hypothetical protein ACT8ZS_19620 [Paenibacillus sp. M.A.Huq-84]